MNAGLGSATLSNMDTFPWKRSWVCWNGVAILFLILSLQAVSAERAKRSLLLQDTNQQHVPRRMHTLFSVECNNYFDWQTVGLMHTYKTSGQPGPITRLLSCTDADLKEYRGMDLAPTHVVPSMSSHPKTGDWYPAINKPAGVLHWLQNHDDAKTVDWVVILDADMIIRHPIVPWELGVKKGEPVSAAYEYLIGCDNILAELHTKHPEYCDKVGGLLVMHIDDLQALAPWWLSKTEEVRADKEHWATNLTGDIYGQGWISEMYGYSFGAAEVGLRHRISNDLMIYPGYIPREGVEPILLHYGLRFSVGGWSFSKADHHDDDIVYVCNQLFPAPPYPKEVLAIEPDPRRRRGDFLIIECMNAINEGLLAHHESRGCSRPLRSKYINFLKVWRTSVRNILNRAATKSIEGIGGTYNQEANQSMNVAQNSAVAANGRSTVMGKGEALLPLPRIHTLFSVECSNYFDWQTVGLVHSFGLSGQPGSLTRLLSCNDEQLKRYTGLDLAPTHVVPSYSLHPLSNDWYPAINKPAAVMHWLYHVETDAEFLIILDADMILRGPITPWDFGAEKGLPVSVPYDYLIGCDNILAKLHTRFPEACDKVGGVFIIHIDDLRRLAPLWLHKTEEVRADRAHWSTNITGDVYGQGWISEMYGYSFGAAEIKLRHRIRSDLMLYPGYIPSENVDPRLLHYGLEFKVGNWRFDKAEWREEDMVNICWKFFPAPPDPASLTSANLGELRRDKLSIECIQTINNALYLHHKRRGCPEPKKDDLYIANGDGRMKTILPSVPGVANHLEYAIYQGENIKEAMTEKASTERNTQLDNKPAFETENLQTISANANRTNRAALEAKHSAKNVTDPVRNVPMIVIRPEYWMIALWALLVFSFLLVVMYLFKPWPKTKTIKKQG